MTLNQNVAMFHCNNPQTHKRDKVRHWRTYKSSILTQAAVAEVLSQADVTQLAGRDLSDLQSHSGALAHRLHAHAHRLHLQHQHGHLQAQECADNDVRVARLDGFPLTVATRDLLPCLWLGRRCSETRR